ncbi:MAG: hypothetical protein QM753_15790 [Thermomicrobiales bacterium]
MVYREDNGTMSEPAYVQPVAVHAMDVTRMIARDRDGGWWLWFGDRPTQPLEAIPAPLASWMLQRPEMQEMPLTRFWFPLDALPVVQVADVIVPPRNRE